MNNVFYSAFTAIVFFTYYWFATAGTWKPIPHETCFYYENYYFYALQSEAFLKGQTHFPIQLPDAFKTKANPYSPWTNSVLRYENQYYDNMSFCLHDASYYNGKIYMYFGAAPAALIYLPTKLITGHYPSPELVVSFLCALAFLFSLLTIAHFTKSIPTRRKYVLITLLGCGLAWGVGTPFVVARSAGYEIPIAAGMLLLAIIMWTTFKIKATGSVKAWMLLGTSIGLISLTRPHLLFILPAVLYFLKDKYPPKKLVHYFLAPLLFLVGISALYNFLRFDSFSEFGLKYQMTLAEPKDLMCAAKGLVPFLKCFSFSALGYLFRIPQFSTRFPFVSDSAAKPGFLDLNFHYNFEPLFGLFFIQPLIWFGFLGLIFLRKHKRINIPFFLLLAVGLIFVSLGVIAGAHSRYYLDFNNLLFVFSASVLVLMLEKKKRLTEIILVLALLWSLPVGFLLGLQGTYRSFERHNSGTYSKIHSIFKPFERILN